MHMYNDDLPGHNGIDISSQIFDSLPIFPPINVYVKYLRFLKYSPLLVLSDTSNINLGGYCCSSILHFSSSLDLSFS